MSVPRLQRSTWLAVGAMVAALLADGGPMALPIPALLGIGLGAAALAGAVAGLALRRAAVAALLLGLGSIGLRATLAVYLAGPGTGVMALPVGSGEWDGGVVDVSSPSGTEQRAFVRLSSADQSSEWQVYAWLPRHPALVPGDRIVVRGTLKAPPTDADGFAGFLESRGAVGTLKAHALELTGSESGFAAAVERLRWGLDRMMAGAIPEPEAGLAAGILIGLRERVGRAVSDDFTATGLTHVVAISGWNIALVAGIATAMLRATGMGRRPRSLVVIVAIVAYTILAGAEASVIRAAVMGGVVIVARESGRPSGAAAALGLAAWGLLLVQPRMIDDIGLQLSLAATAGLLALGSHAEAGVRRLTRAHAPRWFCETLGVSLAAQLATLPLILLHFGRLSLVSPLANLLVAPVVPAAMLGAAGGVLLGPLLVTPVAALLAAPVLLAAWLPLAAMTRGASLLARVPLANVELPAPFDMVAAAAALMALVAALRVVRRRRSWATSASAAPPWEASASAVPPRAASPVRRSRRLTGLAMASVLVSVVSTVLIARPVVELRISVLDIGQGDAILLESSAGGRVLVDGGPDPDLLVRRLDERIPVWDRHIDLAVMTHPHEDHSGGLAGLMPRYRVGRVAETGMLSEGAGVRELRAAASRRGVARNRLVQGDELTLGRARITVLWPPREVIPETSPSSGRAINDTSIVLAVSLGRQRSLLTGDLEEDRDRDLLEAIPRDGRRWDLLKVAHHGSATATSGPLLEVLRPRLAAISSGADNRYGHPAPATLERLASAGARVWRTDRRGTLSVTFDGRHQSAAALLNGPDRRGPCPPATWPGPPWQADGSDACYARPDGGAHSNRSALAAHVYLTVAATAATYDRGGRSGVLPGLSRHAGWPGHRPTPGRDCRAPPRCRQGTAA